ncbi:5'-methylthioadenosine/S-adenosylhomocysteine nucleosidase [Thalassospira sp. TSL5-1]|uniref:5'-methylthioadenosine/S-adenosylhomocysteine nucleosidase n=1 Tax=Thalassospira sp. TSL5-1 TaxID=1544451 RepID=UPI00093C4902|nr:5'-methylthioadenosine/S-adenosylhomocysteine nucleosidase [Thalassospira sp. TSL5-1]OKH87454.1 5'-methylthioadenosine nucleosidase [Thalassospira sp. TSL5-1]
MRDSVVYVMAAPAEYGPHLQAKITPEMIGVGPVEAAVNLTAVLARREIEGKLPDVVVSLGSAGSRHLVQAEIYQVTAVSYRDMDASPLGFEKGCTPFVEFPAIVALPHRIPGIAEATLSTGGNIVSGAAYDSIDADMVDMETYAVWRVCEKFGLPLIGLRGISDGKKELTHISDWTEYLHVIDEKLSLAVDQLEKTLENGDVVLT